MKIKVKNKSYNEVMSLQKMKNKKPKKPTKFLTWLIKFLSKKELKETNFHYELTNIPYLPKEPCLILMNHSSFIDLKIASRIFKNKSYNIVATQDAFIGKNWLMRHLGCIPTKKFISDTVLVKNIKYCLDTLKTNVLLFPEAGYSLDGTNTILPQSLSKLIKLLNKDVIVVITEGAFTRDPLYNNLQLRKINVSAKVTKLFSQGELEHIDLDSIKDKINDIFSYDSFKWQLEKNIRVKETFRADGLERILYKCPYCNTEGKMQGKGILLKCNNCGKQLIMNELGQLEGNGFTTIYSHIPDWFVWEREMVKKEIINGSYYQKFSVKIYMIRDTKAFYYVGDGTLTHNCENIQLISNDNQINYSIKADKYYSINVDYFFYEIGDVISFGDSEKLFYCFPINKEISVCKFRLATEEIYKINKIK